MTCEHKTIREFSKPILMGSMLVKKCIDCRSELEIKMPGKDWQPVRSKK